MTTQPAGATPILELGRGLPGWLLRLVLLLAGCGASLALLGDGLITVVLVVLLVLTVVTAAVPASPAPAMLIGAVAIAVAVAGGDPLRPVVLLEIPLLHLVHLTASISALVPLRAVVRPAALARPARRFLFVQIAVFAVVGIAEILPTGQNTIVVELAGLFAVAGLVALAIRLLTREKTRGK
jgi:nitrate reductase gamma subunit